MVPVLSAVRVEVVFASLGSVLVPVPQEVTVSILAEDKVTPVITLTGFNVAFIVPVASFSEPESVVPSLMIR